MSNSFEQQNTKSSRKPEVQKVVIDMGHAWSPEERQKFKPEFKSNEMEEKDRLKENGERSNKFVSDWEKKFMTTPNISHEELEELAKSGEEIWNLKFDDDEKYFDLKKQLEVEQEKSPYITKEREDLAMQIVQTARGNLESTKKFIDYKFEESQKDIEEKKLQEARAKVYGYLDDYEAFDPKQELKNISKFTEAEKQMTAEEKLNLKKSRLEEYKKKLAEQKIGIAEMNSELENMISNSKEVNRGDLEKFLAKKAKEYKLSKGQFDKYREVFEEAQKRNAVIKDFSKKYAGKQGEFFEAMFGKKPLGKIKIEAGAISFSVICENAQDYAWINSAKYKYAEISADLDEDDLKYGQSTRGHVLSGGTKIKELRNYVTSVNVSFNRSKYDKPLGDTVIHEEKHEINDLINNVFSKEFRHDLKSNEERARDEVLSFFKDGSDTELIKFYLTAKEDEGGHYDYLAKDRRHWQTLYNGYIKQPGYADNPYMVAQVKELKKALEDIENDEKTYYKHIGDALDNLNKLEKLDFSRSKIIGLFQTDEIAKWPKVYERIKSSNEFKDKKSELIQNLEEEIKSWETSADIMRSEIKEIEEYRKSQENLSGLSKLMRALIRKPEEKMMLRKNIEELKRQFNSNLEHIKRLREKKDDAEKI